MKNVLTLVLICLYSVSLMAQTGQYDVRLIQQYPLQCEDEVIYFDIQVKASSTETAFRLAEQNYRFDYDTIALANPRIHQELEISGLIDDGTGTSLYKAHTLQGTLGATISYNIILDGGDGYPLTDNWVSVGRIAFDVVFKTGCFNFTWRTHSEHPVTYIGEMYNDEPALVSEGTYTGFNGCFYAMCTDCPPVLSLSDVIPDNTYKADNSINSDGTIPAGNSVIYKAGDVILLDSGFSTDAQADFSAEISDCN